MKRLTLAALLCLSQAGCLRYYTQYPKDKLDKPPAKRYALLQYRIAPYPVVMDSGRRGLETALREESPFREARQVESPPEKGLYCDVSVKWTQPSFGALAWLVASYASYFLIPQWSVKERYTLAFDVYRDGQLKRSFSYTVGRKNFTWLPLILVTWITAITPNQAEVFQSVVYRFYDDADALFKESP